LILIDRIEWDWALQIAESILALISRLNFNSSMSNEQLNVSVSIGVATGLKVGKPYLISRCIAI
jgi:PleD family two-component response regulator